MKYIKKKKKKINRASTSFFINLELTIIQLSFTSSIIFINNFIIIRFLIFEIKLAIRDRRYIF